MMDGNFKEIPHEIRTPRLLLRRWVEADCEPFAAMNADPRVMEFLGPRLSRAQSDERVAQIRREFDDQGLGKWAVEVPGIAPFIGYIGLAVPRFESHFTPCVEIGWRLAAEHWGHGYATEGARAVLDLATSKLHLPNIVSFTVPANLRSRRVMEKLEMVRNPDEDFDHPSLPAGDPLRRHVLYRMKNAPTPT